MGTRGQCSSCCDVRLLGEIAPSKADLKTRFFLLIFRVSQVTRFYIKSIYLQQFDASHTIYLSILDVGQDYSHMLGNKIEQGQWVEHHIAKLGKSNPRGIKSSFQKVKPRNPGRLAADGDVGFIEGASSRTSQSPCRLRTPRILLSSPPSWLLLWAQRQHRQRPEMQQQEQHRLHRTA